MLALVGLLCMVLVAIQWAANPAHLVWFTQVGGGGRGAAAVEHEEPAPSLDDVEFQALRDDREPLPPGVFRAEFEAAAEPTEAPSPDGFDPTALPTDLLADVKDDQLNLLRVELPAIRYVIDRARDSDEDVLDHAAIKEVTFPLLMTRSDDYRGKLLTFGGTLRQIQPLTPAGGEDFGGNVYEGWMFTPTSDNHPYRVLVTELPPDLSTGTQLEVPVEFTGYFIRRYGYLAQGGETSAPMLIGKTFRLLPRPAPPDPRIGEDLSWFVLGFLLAVGLVFGLLLWRFIVSDRKFRNSRMHQLVEARLDARDEDISALADMDVVDPKRMFENLEEF
jgi:hypothetical protein